jgi:hypothetical protein
MFWLLIVGLGCSVMSVSFIICVFYSFTLLYIDRVYGGGSTGANYGLALHQAKTSGKRSFLICIYIHTNPCLYLCIFFYITYR